MELRFYFFKKRFYYCEGVLPYRVFFSTVPLTTLCHLKHDFSFVWVLHTLSLIQSNQGTNNHKHYCDFIRKQPYSFSISEDTLILSVPGISSLEQYINNYAKGVLKKTGKLMES